MVNSDRKKWFALALLSAVQFMVVLDIAIVNVALPSIQVDLGFSQENLQWVVSAYALVFGGFLLLGGRAADLLGRRRIFLIGIVVFTISSLLAGLAWSEASLIAARAFQGLGAAVITPAALSILSTTFTEGRERNVALGVWGAVGGFGAAAGVLMGGVLTSVLSWSWIFFVNIPVGITAFLLTPVLLRESRDASVKSFDALGAVLVTAGLSSFVYAITQGGTNGWTSAKTLSFFAAAVALLVGFVAWEVRHSEPLMRLGILRIKTVSGANVAGFILGTATFSVFLMLTLYMQDVLGYGPMKTGVAYLAVAGGAIITSAIAAQLVNRIGVKPALLIGMVSLTAGLLYFTQVSVDGSYLGARGGACLRPDQHDAADRRSARHRRPVGDRDLADDGRRRRWRHEVLGARDGLPRRLLGRGDRCRGRRHRNSYPDPSRRARAGGRDRRRAGSRPGGVKSSGEDRLALGSPTASSGPGHRAR